MLKINGLDEESKKYLYKGVSADLPVDFQSNLLKKIIFNIYVKKAVNVIEGLMVRIDDFENNLIVEPFSYAPHAVFKCTNEYGERYVVDFSPALADIIPNSATFIKEGEVIASYRIRFDTDNYITYVESAEVLSSHSKKLFNKAYDIEEKIKEASCSLSPELIEEVLLRR